MYKILAGTFICMVLLTASCRRTINTPDLLPIPNSLVARWTLTQIQGAGNGAPGVWRVADPQGQWMELTQNGMVSGTAFPSATGYRLVDSVTVELTDASQQGGRRLFNYQIDTVARTLRLYIKPLNGVLCIEGCGGYGFAR